MTGNNENATEKFTELRRRAQVFLSAPHSDAQALSPDAVRQLVHELDTYQIELELQNEDLRQAQEELELARRRFADLYEFSPAGYLTVNSKGLIIEANLAAAEMLGVTRGALIKRPLSTFIVADDQDIFYLNRKELLKTLKKQTCELRMQQRGGARFHVQMEIAVNPEIDGELGQFRLSLTDISSCKAVEAELHSLKEKYRSIVMDQNDLICRFDPQGKITFVNNAYCRFFGMRYQDILGTNFQPEIHSDDQEMVHNHFTDLTRLNPDNTLTYRVRLPNGEVHWQQWCGRAFFDADGNLTECQMVGRDTTEQEENKAALEKAHDQLERRVAERTREIQKLYDQLLHAEKLSAIGRFAASIAHEFSNPLSGITNVVKIAKRLETNNKDENALFELAIEECSRLKKLIRDLQNFSRPSLGRMELMDIHSMINSLLLFCKGDFHSRNIEVIKQYSEGMPLIAVVADQIKQVLLNIIINAADAMECGGFITISTEAKADCITIHIKDNGSGIAQEDLDHIFKPFYSTKPEKIGTGLGLAISADLIKKHDGSLEVQSESGKGTVFSIILPIKGV